MQERRKRRGRKKEKKKRRKRIWAKTKHLGGDKIKDVGNKK